MPTILSSSILPKNQKQFLSTYVNMKQEPFVYSPPAASENYSSSEFDTNSSSLPSPSEKSAISSCICSIIPKLEPNSETGSTLPQAKQPKHMKQNKVKKNVIKLTASFKHSSNGCEFKAKNLKRAFFNDPTTFESGEFFKQNHDHQNNFFPKPPFSYSCLIAMSLRNCDTGALPVTDIYEFIVENFPYYKTARDGWKNSIRHNLSLNKCFRKIENPINGSKKGCLWALNLEKCFKLEGECKRFCQRDPVNIRLSMQWPEDFNDIECGVQRVKKYLQQATQGHNQQLMRNQFTTEIISLSI